MRRTDKREFLQQLHKLLPTGDEEYKFKQAVGGMFVSRKLDGMQAFWDGGITAGMPAHEVPWANTAKDKKLFRSTGLWTRYGKTVQAPEKWLKALPKVLLVGELYAGLGNFHKVMSACRKHVPVEEEWDDIMFWLYDAPAESQFCASGRIKVRDWEVTLDYLEMKEFLSSLRKQGRELEVTNPMSFERALELLSKFENNIVRVVPQMPLPFSTKAAEAKLLSFFNEEVDRGGEGVVIRSPQGVWTPTRSKDVLKLKKEKDEEGMITGFTTGREGKEDRRTGRIGALIIEDESGNTLKVAGINETESLLCPDGEQWAASNPDKELPNQFTPRYFERGQRITFTYYQKSPYGVPLQPRYKRHA